MMLIFLGELSALTVGIAITGLLLQPFPLPGHPPSLVETLFAREALAASTIPLKSVYSDLDDTLIIPNDGAEGVLHPHLTPVTERLSQLPLNNHQPKIKVYRPMKVTFRQSGGFTGLIKGCEIDTDLLPSDEAIRLQSLVEQSGVLNAEGGGRTPNARDLFDYEIIVEMGKDIYNVSFDSNTMPRDVGPLLEYLKSRATPRSPR